jgi:predicted flap endonuclease-1-like 5' DNA nuclease
MLYDVSFLWIWLTLAFLLGGLVGWLTEVSSAQSRWFFGWFRAALIAWLVGLALAWLHWLPGRLGFWLESALLFFAFYVVGCLLGGLLRTIFEMPEAAGVGPLARGGESWWSLTGTASRAVSGASALVAPRASAVVSDDAVSPARPASALASEPVVAPIAAAVVPGAAPARAASAQEPAAMGPVEGQDQHEGERPHGLVAPRGGVPDDLKHIRGVGHQNEGRLHALGTWHFQQIADWTPENVRWVGSYLAFPGRIDREQWIAQAKVLATGQETEFSTRVERGEVAGKRDDGTEGQQNIADISKIKPHE